MSESGASRCACAAGRCTPRPMRRRSSSYSMSTSRCLRPERAPASTTRSALSPHPPTRSCCSRWQRFATPPPRTTTSGCSLCPSSTKTRRPKAGGASSSCAWRATRGAHRVASGPATTRETPSGQVTSSSPSTATPSCRCRTRRRTRRLPFPRTSPRRCTFIGRRRRRGGRRREQVHRPGGGLLRARLSTRPLAGDRRVR
mmetsp:Transcript_22369/g.65306  ORF Transcript_22369/g.65306 Transcript_22369/m.65306 type:complete len:200 (+) Transcript_22369:426-1025(+)